MHLPMSTEERKSVVALLKGAWFFVVSAGRYIKNGTTDFREDGKHASEAGKYLDKYLEEIT